MLISNLEVAPENITNFLKKEFKADSNFEKALGMTMAALSYGYNLIPEGEVNWLAPDKLDDELIAFVTLDTTSILAAKVTMNGSFADDIVSSIELGIFKYSDNTFIPLTYSFFEGDNLTQEDLEDFIYDANTINEIRVETIDGDVKEIPKLQKEDIDKIKELYYRINCKRANIINR